MSHTSNQVVSTWKVVEEFLTRRKPEYYTGTIALDSVSRTIVRDAYMLWYLSTWDTLVSSGTPLSDSDTKRWLIAICSVPVREMVDLLKEASHLLVTSDLPTYDAFKQHLRKSYPTCGAILAPLRREFHRWFHENETDALYLCYSWLLFISRLNLPGLTALEEEALSSYLRIEENIQEDGFTSCESSILQSWFPRSLEDMAFLTENHAPQHGPGSTADAGRVLQQKYECLDVDSRITMLNRRVYGDLPPYPRVSLKKLSRISSTIFVPKSLGSYRTISMEPSSLMWHQKGVRNALMKLLRRRKHYILRRFQPEHQQPNRDLAWEGSLSGEFSTIDLSSASDTVSWFLVKKWFGNTSLYPWLLWTRSTHTRLPNGQEIKLRKFAPMGSDLCFPVETIIFAAITECAIIECGGDPMTSRYRVYGDDIIVEEEYATAVFSRLEQNGFILNRGKTFTGSQPRGFFRESCGGFFFNGVDISPVRLSRWFTGYTDLDVSKPGRIESLIELANDCFDRYPSVRRWLITLLLELPVHLRPPFSSDGSTGLFSTEATNFHLMSKESEALQTVVYKFGRSSVGPRTRNEEWEDIRLYEYLRQVEGRQRLTWPEDRVIVDVSPISQPLWKSTTGVLY